MLNQITPSTRGQICEIIKPQLNENRCEVYIITQHIDVRADEPVYIISLKELLRFKSEPALILFKRIPKCELNVIAEDLDEYIGFLGT